MTAMLTPTEDKDYQREEEYRNLLHTISEDIILESILDQIEDVIVNVDQTVIKTNKSFEYFEERLMYLLNTYGQDGDKIGEIYQHTDQILNKISKAIEEVYNFSIEYSEVIPSELKFQYVKAMYNFFILDIKDNVQHLAYNYIYKNRDTFKNLFSKLSNQDKKNLEYIHIKEVIDNDYTNMLYHLNDIVDTIEIPISEDVLDFIIDEDPHEINNYMMDRLFNNNEFVDLTFETPLINNLKPLLNENTVVIVRNKLIKKLS